MAKKAQDSGDDYASLADTVRESAQQIWLAGLGAFSRAQQEGGKVFEALVKEGVSIQKRTHSAAEEKLSEASNRMAAMASDLSNKASGQWDKLETLFEDRVSRALKTLGVPTSRDLDALARRIEELDRKLATLRGDGGGARTRTTARTSPTKRPVAKASARKRAPARKAAG